MRAALVSYIIQSGEKPPRVTMSQEGIKISAGIYGIDLPWSVVTDVSLEETLPRVIRRTNGYALGGTLRGYFRVEGEGPVRLGKRRASRPRQQIVGAVEDRRSSEMMAPKLRS